MGPRAPGKRSIVADPSSKRMGETINKIKGKEFWRLVAPAVLDKDKREFFKDPVEHQFIVLKFEMAENRRERAPGVCHLHDLEAEDGDSQLQRTLV